MNKDFRISVALPTHPKTIMLMRQAGDRAFYSLVRLWAYVAQNKPSGELTDLSTDYIEIAADWQGEPGAFVQALVDLRFLDPIEGGYRIHDWEEHNGYASAAGMRSEKARKAAKAKWQRADDAQAVPKQCSSNAQADNEQCLDKNEQCPSPSPTPTPSPKPKKKEYTDDFERFWSAYPRKVAKGDAFKAWQRLNGTAPDADELIKVVEQQKQSPQWQRENGKFIPHPATWLNQERWHDEIQQPPKVPSYMNSEIPYH